jgi:quercetin dioxygenase-like cupin family protein
MNLPDYITHHFSDGLYAKEASIPAGTMLMQHKHTYSHFGILAKGKVVVVNDGDIKIYDAPACINIEAGTHHGIKAVTDCVWFCIHATDEKDPSKVDEVLIQGE